MKLNTNGLDEKIAKVLVISFFILIFYISGFVVLFFISRGVSDYYKQEIADGYYYEYGTDGVERIVYDGEYDGTRGANLDNVSYYRNLEEYILYSKTIINTQADVPGMNALVDGSDSVEYESQYFHGRGVYYFILEKASCTVYGPYIYDELVDKCNELNIRIF